MYSVGLALKLIREEKGMSQQIAANEIRKRQVLDNSRLTLMTKDILANIESDRSKCQADLIPYFCMAYECSTSYIFSYFYKSERQYREDFEKQEGLIEFFNRVDPDYLTLALYIANSKYFKGSLLEEAALVVCDKEVKVPLHNINWTMFKKAIDNNDTTDDDIVQILIKHETEFIKMCNQLKGDKI